MNQPYKVITQRSETMLNTRFHCKACSWSPYLASGDLSLSKVSKSLFHYRVFSFGIQYVELVFCFDQGRKWGCLLLFIAQKIKRNFIYFQNERGFRLEMCFLKWVKIFCNLFVNLGFELHSMKNCITNDIMNTYNTYFCW